MRADLDRLMAERGFDGLVVLGASNNNAAMYYLANGANVTERTVLVKKRGEAPVLFVNAMDREEAAKSGLRVVLLNQFDMPGLLREAQGNHLHAAGRLAGQLLAEAGLTGGRVAVYGRVDLGSGLEWATAVSELNPSFSLVGEYVNTVLSAARVTKDPDEIRRMRAVGRKTIKVVAGTEEFLTSHRARDGYLVKKDGTRLTVGDVKRRIRQMLAEEDLVDAENGTIFSIGRDAGVPHSRGNDRSPIALGQTIIYDIFPAEAGGGYFFDFTRTWCLGYAPPEIEQAYADVLHTFRGVMRALKPGMLCRDAHAVSNDLLEARGHPTLRSDPKTTSGYIHSIAHGLGLEVHEAPSFYDYGDNPARLEPGMVITVEPGVYYPERGYGIRIEDAVWLNPKNMRFEPLATYHKELVLPVKGVKGKRK